MTAPALVTEPVIQYIRLSNGEAKYTWGATLTERQGVDISSDAMVLGLGTRTTPPATSQAPDIRVASTIVMSDYLAQGGANPFNLPLTTILHQLTGQIMISAAGLDPVVGSYWVWARIVDQSETEWFQFHKVTIS